MIFSLQVIASLPGVHLLCAVEIYNNGLLGEGKIETFCLDIGRIIGNFYFSLVLMGTFVG